MLPPLSSTCMALLDYLACEAPNGEPVEVVSIITPSGNGNAANPITARSLRRRVPSLRAYGLITTDQGPRATLRVRITPLGVALIESFYASADLEEAAK